MAEDAVRIDVLVEDVNASRNLQKVEGAAKKSMGTFTAEANRGTVAGKKFTGMLGGMGRQLIALSGGFALFQTLRKSVTLFMEQENAVQRLTAALHTQGYNLPGVVKSMEDYAASLQKVTTLGDEEIIRGMALATSMGATVDQAKELAKAAGDMSVAFGVDFAQAVQMLGKTLGGTARELGMLMPEVKAMSSAELRGGGAVRAVMARFGGMASMLAQTDSGRIKQAAAVLGDEMQRLGAKIIPLVSEGLTQFAKALGATIDFLSPGDQPRGGSESERKTLEMIRRFNPAMAAQIQARYDRRVVRANDPSAEWTNRMLAKQQSENERVKAIGGVNDLLAAGKFSLLAPDASKEVADDLRRVIGDTDLGKFSQFMDSLGSPAEQYRKQVAEIEGRYSLVARLRGVETGDFMGITPGDTAGKKAEMDAARFQLFQRESPVMARFGDDLGLSVSDSLTDGIRTALQGGGVRGALTAFSQTLARAVTDSLADAIVAGLMKSSGMQAGIDSLMMSIFSSTAGAGAK